MSRSLRCAVLFSTVLGLASGCGGGSAPAVEQAAEPAAGNSEYPAPRWPSYFKPPTSVEDLLPAARRLVRNTSGFQGKGLGVVEAGEAVLLVPTEAADPMVVEAIKRALVERRVTPHVKYTYEFMGLTREQAERFHQQELRGREIERAGLYQAASWIEGQFPDPSVPKAWLKQRRPDIYAELFPLEASGGGSGADPQVDELEGRAPTGPEERTKVGQGIQAYFKAHPEVRGVFWGSGGTTGLRRALYPMQDRYLGTFITDNLYTLQSQMSTYPGDVWQLAEEQLLEPLAYAERIEVTDPEGANLWADLTPEMAERWSQGAYQRGHLYMFPNQATGRFGYSFVNYPGFQQKWLPREPIARVNGVLAGTQGVGGFFPSRWEVIFKDGFIADVKGGGAFGAALKEFLQYPGLNDRVFPYHKEPGFWYLYEIAFGSHPKAFRQPALLLESGSTGSERARGGVIHWGLGIRLWHDPDAPTESKSWAEFSKKNNTPFDHDWHTLTFFTTYRVRLRNADKWVALLDKGRMTSLDNPEVRALASRYGDPEYVLSYDWIPEMPGINAPGDYLRDYAQNPGRYAVEVVKKAMNGTYEHYFPPVAPAPPSETAPGSN